MLYLKSMLNLNVYLILKAKTTSTLKRSKQDLKLLRIWKHSKKTLCRVTKLGLYFSWIKNKPRQMAT